MHDNTERSKNVIMAAVPPSSNAMNAFADIVVHLETSSASYSSRSLARHPSLLNVKLLTYYRWPEMYSSNESKRAPTTIVKARRPRIGISGRDVDATTAFLNWETSSV